MPAIYDGHFADGAKFIIHFFGFNDVDGLLYDSLSSQAYGI